MLKNTLSKNVSQSDPAGHAARLKLLTVGHIYISICILWQAKTVLLHQMQR